MTPAERIAKVAELRAEADRLERGWPECVEAMMVFRHRDGSTYITAFPGGDDRLVLVHLDSRTAPRMNGTKAGFDGFGKGGKEAFTYLGYACDVLAIKTPDAPEPTGAGLVGKVCDVSDDGVRWRKQSWGRIEVYEPERGYSWGSRTRWYKFARLYREDRP